MVFNMRHIEYSQAYYPLLLKKEECGDVGVIEKSDNVYTVALIDGLGHGKLARSAALLARRYIIDHKETPLDNLIKGMHIHLKGSRGVVVGICRVDTTTGKVEYCGMGNIKVKQLGDKSVSYVSKDGVVGYLISTPIVHVYQLIPRDILVLFSDGIQAHFGSDEKQRWRNQSAQSIVNDIMCNYKTSNDDASCIVIIYHESCE